MHELTQATPLASPPVSEAVATLALFALLIALLLLPLWGYAKQEHEQGPGPKRSRR